MEKQATQVLEEIRQLIAQYRQELPGGRRAWPESIKIRIAQLCELGMSAKEVAGHTGLSDFTILGWVPQAHRRRYRPRRSEEPSSGGHFAPVTIRERRPMATVTAAKSPAPAQQSTPHATLTVTLSGEIRIEGVTPEFLRSWLGRGGGV